MPRLRRSERARSESSYRVRRVGGVAFFTSRRRFGDLTVVVERFPRAAPSGPDFVLVHGLGVSSRYFEPVAAELSRRGQVHLVDLPGHGASPHPRRDVSIADHASVLAQFLEQTGLVDAVLVGHSMGVQVITRLVVDRPDVASRVVLMAPTLAPQLRSAPRSIARLLLDGTREPLRVVLLNVWDYLVRCGVGFGLRQLHHAIEDRMEQRLPRMRARTLVIEGDRDPLVPHEWALEVTGLVPGAILVTVPGPHVVMHTAPREVAALIDRHAELP